MKRIFIILCLITICNISYADIASVGYVDSVVATKQDTITDIETIRTGAAAGATAVQPSSLSAVATSGSYNDLSNKPTIPTVPTTISSFTNDSGYITNSYHDSTKQDKLPNVPGNNGIYKLVWNGNTGQIVWEFEQYLLTCTPNTYDIGFSQCIDPSTKGTSYGHNASTMTWRVDFPYGRVSGIASCTPDSGHAYPDRDYEQTVTGQYCYCKMTHPVSSAWVYFVDYGSTSDCSAYCADHCGYNVRDYADIRGVVFGSAGN